MKPLRSCRNARPQPIRHKLLQAEPKIWEAPSAKPTRHKLLHQVPPDQVAKCLADQYLHGATLVVVVLARVLEMVEVVP